MMILLESGTIYRLGCVHFAEEHHPEWLARKRASSMQGATDGTPYV